MGDEHAHMHAHMHACTSPHMPHWKSLIVSSPRAPPRIGGSPVQARPGSAKRLVVEGSLPAPAAAAVAAALDGEGPPAAWTDLILLI